MSEDKKPSLESYKRMFAEARDLLGQNRREQQIDDDYYHGYQLTSEERRILQDRKQPDTVFNRYRKAINGTLGVLKQGETDPRAYGRNPGDDDAAETVSKVLRFCADINDFDDMRVECAYDYLVPGHCAALVEIDERKRPKLTQVRWEEFFYDPRSRKKDYSDARYMGVAKWMYADTVKALYKDKETDIENALSTDFQGGADETFEDRPRDAISNWIDRKNGRLMVVEIYHRDAQGWMRCVFHAGGILEAGPSPYLDEKKRPECAIIAQACYIDRENNRMGIGRDMRSPQDEFNKRRQKLLNLLNNRQVQAVDANIAMAVDADLVRAEASRPDGALPAGWQVVPFTDITTGQFQLLALAEGEMDREGPNPAVLGRQGETQSGRAQLVRQQAGLTEQAVIFGGLEAWELRMYRAIWNRCKQFWTAPDYIRVTDDEGAPQFIGINQPKYGEPMIMANEQGMPMIGRPILGYDNSLAELDVDITLDSVPDTANLAQEQFLALIDLAKAGVQIPPMLLIEASSLPKKREILEKMEQMAAEPDPTQQMQMEAGKAEIEKTQSETALNVAKAQTESVKPLEMGLKAGHASGPQQPPPGETGATG